MKGRLHRADSGSDSAPLLRGSSAKKKGSDNSVSASSSTSTLASATTAPDPTIIGERPTFDLGDDDAIADGGTQIMAKGKAQESSPKGSGLDTLDAMVTKAKSDPPPAMKAFDPAVKLPPPPPMMKLASKTPTVVGGIGIEVDPTLAVASKESPAPAVVAAPLLDDLADDDLAGETKIDRTQPFDRDVVVAAAAEQALALPGLSLPNATGGLPALPSVMVSPSIAPFSIDVPSPPSGDGTQKLPAAHAHPQQPRYYVMQAAPPPKSNQMTVLAAAIGGGVALCAAALIALIVFATSEENTRTGAGPSSSPKPVTTAPLPKQAAQPLGPPKPREAQQSSIRSAVIETPETTPRKVDPPTPAQDESGTPVTSPLALPSAPSSSTPKGASAASADTNPPLVKEPKEKKAKSSATVQPPPPPEPAAVAPPPSPPPTPAPATTPAPKVTSTVGTIDIPGSLMTVMVDGEYKRVSGGKVVVQCGRHKVNAGRGTQIVDVPCGGSISVQ